MARPDMKSLSANGTRRIYSLLCAMAHCDGRGITPKQARILARYQATLDLPDAECRRLERDASRLDRLNMGKARKEQKLLLDGLIEVALSDGVLGRREETLLLGVAKRCKISRKQVRDAVKAHRNGKGHGLEPRGQEAFGIDSASYVEFDPTQDEDIYASGDPHHPDSSQTKGSGLFGGLQAPRSGKPRKPSMADPFASSVEVGSLRRAEESLFGGDDPFAEQDDLFPTEELSTQPARAASGFGDDDELFPTEELGVAFADDDPFEDSLIQAALEEPAPRRAPAREPRLPDSAMDRLLTSAEIDDSGEFEWAVQADPSLLAESLCLPSLPSLPDLPADDPLASVDDAMSSAGYRPRESLDAPLGLDASRVDDDGDPLLRDESETLMFPGEDVAPSSPFDALGDDFALDLDSGSQEDLQSFWAEQSQSLPTPSSSRRRARRSAPSAEDSLAGLLD